MMSNTTLDAAKTSRMLQLLQTQANLIDLNQLAEGLMIDEEDMVNSYNKLPDLIIILFYIFSRIIILKKLSMNGKSMSMDFVVHSSP
jgi:hypothetical protein